MTATKSYLTPTEDAGRALFQRGFDGPVLMLNLLRFRATADYSADPALAPARPISGTEAYALYARGIAPLLAASGGAVLYEGEAGPWFIGPEAEHWDRVLITRQASVARFFGFATDPAAQAFQGHRTAALADSRLLPMLGTLPFPSFAP